MTHGALTEEGLRSGAFIMKIYYMREYITVVDTLNFTTAAARLYTTQSVLSRHISAIEEAVGAQLFIRNTHGMTVTNVGKMVYTEFKRILKIYDAALEKASRMSLMHTGALRIGVPYYCLDYIDRIIPSFFQKHGNIIAEMVSFQPSYAYEAIQEDRIDLALLFRHDYPDSEAVRFHDFCREYLVVVCETNHPLSLRETVAWRDLQGQTVIKFQNNYFSDYIQNLMHYLGIRPAVTVVSDNIDTLIYTLKGTNGLAVEPKSVENMSRKNLRFIPLEDQRNYVNMTFAYRSDNNNPAIPVFLKHVDLIFTKVYTDRTKQVTTVNP